MAGKRRPTRWWWSDWMADQGVRAVSLAARGLWMDMLAIMAEGEPVGHLTEPSGRRMSPASLAARVGADPETVTALLDELHEQKVFSRTMGGVIYSRRMVRDQSYLEAQSNFGHKGGNPVLLATSRKKREKLPTDKGADKPPDNHPPYSPMPITKKDNISTTTSPSAARALSGAHEADHPDPGAPSTEGGAGGGGIDDSGGDGMPPVPSLLPDIEAMVARIWGAARTRHGSDEATVREWLDLGLEPEVILARIAAVATDEAEKGSRSPTALRFFDRAVRSSSPPPRRDVSGTAPIEWDARIRTYRDRGFWLRDHWGPTPEERGCQAPPATRRKHGYG